MNIMIYLYAIIYYHLLLFITVFKMYLSTYFICVIRVCIMHAHILIFTF